MSAEATTPCPKCNSFAVQRRSNGLYCLVCGRQRDQMRTRTAPFDHSRAQGTPPITGTESTKPCPKCQSTAVQRRSDGVYCLICGAVKSSQVEESLHVSTPPLHRSTIQGSGGSEVKGPNNREFDPLTDSLPRVKLTPYFQRIYEDAQNLYKRMGRHIYISQPKIDFVIYLLDVIPRFSMITPKSTDFTFWSTQKKEQLKLARKRLSDELELKVDEWTRAMERNSDDHLYVDELFDLASYTVRKVFLDM